MSSESWKSDFENWENDFEKITDDFYNKISVSDSINMNDINISPTDFVGTEQTIKNDGMIAGNQHGFSRTANASPIGGAFPIAKVKSKLSAKNIGIAVRSSGNAGAKAGLHKFFTQPSQTVNASDTASERLKDDLCNSKSALFTETFATILTDVISLKENMADVIAHCTDKQSSQYADSMVKAFSDFLKKYNVESFKSTDNEYHPESQRAVETVEMSGRKELSGKICRHISCGYSLNGKVIYPEAVSVYGYTEENTDKN